jgi:hypothetical protein
VTVSHADEILTALLETNFGREACMYKSKKALFGEISGSDGGEYEDDCLLGCCVCSLVEVYRRFRGACLTRRPVDGGSKHL